MGVAYLMTSRPPGIGCQPDGWIERETWLPAHEVDGRYFLGRVVYPERLSPEQVYRYELWPEDEVERAKLIFAREPEWIREDYMAQEVEFLEELADRDQLAWAALVLKSEGWFRRGWRNLTFCCSAL